jgi:4-diphosphocytidyl-2-C-methyl-D-erythritol kinase
VIAPVSFYDKLRFERTESHIELVCEGEGVPTGEDNLAMQAASLLRETSGADAGARITLKKSIPAGSGLGGGSSDAAATLASLNQLWGLGLELERLLPLAGRLGADVPFFMYGALAQVSGRGERVIPLENKLGEVSFVVAIPPFGVSTSAVYARVRVSPAEQRRSASRMIEGFLTGKHELVADSFYNRLQEAAFDVEPRLREFYRELGEATNSAVVMSGSGSAFFMQCESAKKCQETAELLKAVDLARVISVNLLEKDTIMSEPGADR